MRLFVAAWPPPEVCDVLDALDRPEHPLVRWTTPDQWHVTLRFLGDVPDDDLTGLVDALHAVGARPPATAELGPATRRYGRAALVAPVSGLDELRDAVVAAVEDHGEPQEGRSFTGHLTLARARRGRSLPAELPGQPVAASWLVRDVALVRSHLEPTGARYETLAKVALGG